MENNSIDKCKFLQDYMEDKQTKLFKATDTFFAFSDKQFEEGKKEGVKYVSMGAGMITNKLHVTALVDGLDRIHKESIQTDIKENGIDSIIDRELSNHECYYTGDIQDCVDKLEGYSIDRQAIMQRFKANYSQQEL